MTTRTTADRVEEILRDCCSDHNVSLATDLLHEEFVIIHREDIPFSQVKDGAITIPGSPHWSLTGQSYAKLFREAIRLISRAEAVERYEAEQESAAQRVLEAEAVEICNKVAGLPFDEPAPIMNMKHWTKVAKAAREVYGVTQ
jgi:bifunctional pyridoxal-dependent enzyme with beta-cystathionase and maltose regulon repressor activities